MSAQRDVRVRVRSQFAALYPELATGGWVSAREFAQVIVARASQARRESLHRRTLDLRHFEVRGALDHARAPAASRGRLTPHS
jgi:hypothetical protein